MINRIDAQPPGIEPAEVGTNLFLAAAALAGGAFLARHLGVIPAGLMVIVFIGGLVVNFTSSETRYGRIFSWANSLLWQIGETHPELPPDRVGVVFTNTVFVELASRLGPNQATRIIGSCLYLKYPGHYPHPEDRRGQAQIPFDVSQIDDEGGPRDP